MAEHRLITLDAETYYDKEYSLRKMTPAEYILDPRFELIMCSVKEYHQPVQIIDGLSFGEYIKRFDPANTTTITFNSLFDNAIFAWRYGFVPARMIDAMGMARALLGDVLPRVSLEKVVEYLGLGHKGDMVKNVIGMRRQDIVNRGMWDDYSQYCKQDCIQTEMIFDKLIPDFPQIERRVMDLVLRCTIEPMFRVDKVMLAAHLDDLARDKAELLERCGLQDRNELMSNDKFAQLLINLGVQVEFKQSPTDPTRLNPAFAKTDEFMAELQEHEDPRVQALVEARLGHKSTMEEARGQRFMAVADLPWKACFHVDDLIPLPLRYAGAHTLRLSGDWKMNPQNLPAGRGGQTAKLRKALIAGPDARVVKADLSQIEARLTAWLCGQDDLLDQFRNKKDPYGILGAQIFGLPVPVTPKEVALFKDSIYRFVGKKGILGLGFGAAGPKFYTMVIRDAITFGMDLDALKLIFTPEVSKKSVATYRRTNHKIVAGWHVLDRILETAWLGLSGPTQWGPVTIGHGYVMLPNGMKLRYHNPRRENFELWYDYGGRRHKIYGAKFMENIVQALARVIAMNAAVRISNRGFRFSLQEHDALAFVVATRHVDLVKEIVHTEMTRAPSWAPDLPLAIDLGVGQSYGDTK